PVGREITGTEEAARLVHGEFDPLVTGTDETAVVAQYPQRGRGSKCAVARHHIAPLATVGCERDEQKAVLVTPVCHIHSCPEAPGGDTRHGEVVVNHLRHVECDIHRGGILMPHIFRGTVAIANHTPFTLPYFK